MAPAPTRRQSLAAQATPQELDRLAQSYGFPSALALQRVTRLGVHLHSGGRVTQKWLDYIAPAYPAISPATLAEYAQNIHTVDDLASVVGIDASDAHRYVAQASLNEVVDAVGTRADARADKMVGATDLDAIRKQNAPLREATTALRADILRSFNAHNPAVELNELPARERRTLIADAMDANVAHRQNAAITSRAEIEGGETDKHYAARTLHDDLRRSFDSHAMQDTAEAELNSADIEDVMNESVEEAATQR